MTTYQFKTTIWAFILITVGVVWLLGNIGFLPPFNFWRLFELWPLLLIIGGLNMLIGKKANWLRTLISLLALASAMAYVYLGPTLGIF